ncbi:MAG: DNA repair protein RecN [Micrococcales bacterium]
MIEEISISDLGVIGDATLEFSKGFTVLTGETGAGKTMVLSALGLLLGARADASTIRRGSSQTFVQGRWYLNSDKPGARENLEAIGSTLEAAGVNFGSDELILNRSVSAEGRSRASANGRAVPVSTVAELGEKLVVVHGQADQLRLKSPAAQREALDQYAGPALASIKAEYEKVFRELVLAQERLDELTSDSAARAAELEELRIALELLEKADPKEGEFDSLSELAERLSNLESLRSGVQAAHEALSASELGENLDASILLGAARKSLEPLLGADARLSEFVERLREVGYQVSDLARELSSYVSGLDSDSEQSLESIQERRSLLTSLTRRFACDYEELPKLAEGFAKRLAELDDSDESVENLRAQIADLQSRATSLAAEMSSIRRAAAEELSAEVSSELAGLAMGNSRLIVRVEALEQLRLHGRDEVSILLATGAGHDARPVAKSASGGELSRIMLSIEVVLAKSAQAPTFIFDEVDAGIGGSTAIEIGRRLARLSQNAQVIVVTHLAQVAAFADKHLKVSKTQDGEVTSSDVVDLSGDSRTAELARMLSGLSESTSARESALELLNLARRSE